uniref:C2H2-type domain-containing protein n=1 Tax=Strigamia maritima TaxID=126957 RepID=T1JD30_STRMM
MGLAPTDLASNVVVLEDEIEDELPSPLPEDAFKLPSDICNNIRANYTQIYQRTKAAKVDPPEATVVVNPDVPPVKRKRGRPRKDTKLKVVEPIINSEVQKDEVEKSPKRKRRRKTIAKTIETNEFLSVTACGLCWEEFKDQVSCDKHVAIKHGTQGPLDSEKLLMKEQKAKLQKMMRQHGILTCPNQHCKKPLLSITGYLNHIKNCKLVSIEVKSFEGFIDINFFQEESVLNNVSNSESDETPQLQKSITCRECKQTFAKDEAFETHALVSHHGLARVVGDERPFTEDDRISAQKKMLKQFGSIPCPNCPKSYLSIQGLQYHLRTCKSDTCQDMVCNYCRLLFTNLQTFREHVIAKHNGLALPVGDERVYNHDEKQKILLQVLRVNQKLICLNDGCLEEFKFVEDYFRHEESCLKAKPIFKIECGVCKQKFNTQSQFNNHSMIAHNGLARKFGLNQTFTEEEKLQALRKTLHVLKRLHCLRDGCGKTFISMGGYQYHLQICGQEVTI